jgi:NDP-4-keto-2,6-dideoxyhexose 3-C-methyltransferase
MNWRHFKEVDWMYRKIEACRICAGTELVQVLDLGEQMLTGVFPRSPDPITSGPLRLVKCSSTNGCGLVQLEHSFDSCEMYGENYGYRSGLNASMVEHLHAKVRKIAALVSLRSGDVVVDIGSNDCTTLKAYPDIGLRRIGIDPTAAKFASYYPENIDFVPDFFTRESYVSRLGRDKATVITSFSMLYDLERPVEFVEAIRDCLADDGIWVFEQSYMPTMVDRNAYDTVCHEHLEYYCLRQIKWMLDAVGLKIIDVEFNDVNGGSFSVTAAHSEREGSAEMVERLIETERDEGYEGLEPMRRFAERVGRLRRELLAFVDQARSEGKTVMALGASTKGNVILQYCGFSENQIEAVGEVNPDKFGCFTPGTRIPIVPEADVISRMPDYAIVLPWHFRAFFESSKTLRKLDLVFPLPEIEILPKSLVS